MCRRELSPYTTCAPWRKLKVVKLGANYLYMLSLFTDSHAFLKLCKNEELVAMKQKKFSFMEAGEMAQ